MASHCMSSLLRAIVGLPGFKSGEWVGGLICWHRRAVCRVVVCCVAVQCGSYSMRDQRATRTRRRSWSAFLRATGRSLYTRHAAHPARVSVEAVQWLAGRRAAGVAPTDAEARGVEQLRGDGSCSPLVQVVFERRVVHAGKHAAPHSVPSARIHTHTRSSSGRQ